MKYHQSHFLKATAVFFIFFPFIYLILSAIVFDIPLRLLVPVFLSPFYLFLCFWTVFAGYGLLEMKRWSWYVFTFAIVLILYENIFLITRYSESHNKALAFILSVGFLVLLFYRINREIRVPYFMPRIRWWESSLKYQMAIPVQVVGKKSVELNGKIMDLSLSGCFVKLKEDLEQDEDVVLNFQVFGQKIECKGTVVWRGQSSVTHPKGIGIKFEPMTRNQRRRIKVTALRLRKVASLYRKSPKIGAEGESNDQTFTSLLDGLQKNDSGNI